MALPCHDPDTTTTTFPSSASSGALLPFRSLHLSPGTLSDQRSLQFSAMGSPEKKVVLKLDLHDDKAKQKAMKAVSTVSGIDSIAMDMKEKKMTVIGVADPVELVSRLRKFWRTEIVSIGPAKEPKPPPAEEPKKEEAKPAEEKKEEGAAAKKEDAPKSEEKKEEPAAAKKEEPAAKKDQEEPAPAAAKKEEPKKDPNEHLQELIKNIPRPYYPPHYMAAQAYYPYATPQAATQYYYPNYMAAQPAAQYPYISQPHTQTRYAPQPVEEEPSSCTIL